MQLSLVNWPPATEWNVGVEVGVRPQPVPLERSAQLTVLADLSEWVPPARLKYWIDQEIESLNRDLAQMPEPPRQCLDHRPKVLLTLLSFAYATRIFGHEEVAARCGSDAMFRLICDGEAPSVQDLTNFRRRNRLLLERILAGVFLRAIRHRFGLDPASLSPELAQDLHTCAAERLDVARHVDTDE